MEPGRTACYLFYSLPIGSAMCYDASRMFSTSGRNVRHCRSSLRPVFLLRFRPTEKCGADF
eukprot:1049446-Heterocapsa_arctica.AAC.1